MKTRERRLLCNNRYLDFDMTTCGPNLICMVQLAARLNVEMPYLQEFVDNCETFFAKAETISGISRADYKKIL